MKVALEHRSSFSGEAELELLRLPAGVTAKKNNYIGGERIRLPFNSKWPRTHLSDDIGALLAK